MRFLSHNSTTDHIKNLRCLQQLPGMQVMDHVRYPDIIQNICLLATSKRGRPMEKAGLEFSHGSIWRGGQDSWGS